MDIGEFNYRSVAVSTILPGTSDEIVAVTASSTITLPAASTQPSGRRFILINNGTGVTVTVAPNGTDTINGSNSSDATLVGQFQTAQYVCDGSGAWLRDSGANSKTATTISSASTTAFVVGANGLTNPQLAVDTSTASVANGVKVTGSASGANVALVVTSAGPNDGLKIDALGSGGLTLAGTSTGDVGIGNATAVANFGVAAITFNGGGTGLTFGTGASGLAAGGSGPTLATPAGFLKFKVQGVASFTPFWR